MTMQEQLLGLIKAFEGCKLKAYLCPAGVPTLGYGHTKGVKLGDTCTQAQADQWALEDTREAVATVRAEVKVPLRDCQVAALADFVYNCGAGNFRRSTLLHLVNSGHFSFAAAEFEKWNQAGGVVLPGLTRRRKAERDVFEGKTA